MQTREFAGGPTTDFYLRSRSESLTGAPAWVVRFLEYRNRVAKGEARAGMRPRDFGAPAARIEVRSVRTEQRAADGSSLTKVPQHVRDLVAKWTTDANRAAVARRQRMLEIALS